MATRKNADPNGSEFRFVKLVEDWCDHPKAVEAGDAACGAWSRILSYTARSMRSFVPGVLALHFAFEKLSNLDRLVEVGLMELEGTGYRMHDWETWQAELHEIVESKRKRQEKAAKGGKAKAEQAALKQTQADASSAKQTQAGLSSAKQNGKASQGPAITGEIGDSAIWQTETKTKTKTEIETDLSGSGDVCSRQGKDPEKIPTQPPATDQPVEPSAVRQLFNEWYQRGGPTKENGQPFQEKFEEFEKALRKSSAILPEFAAKARLRLDCFDVDDRPERSFRLGMIRTFLQGGKWREQKGPPQTVPPLTSPTSNQYSDCVVTAVALPLREII
jgi:hypothetical protein